MGLTCFTSSQMFMVTKERTERWHELVTVETSHDVRVAITSFSSFSSCMARMTMGPRTAYSTRFTLGFMLSRVSTFPRLESPFTALWDMFALSRTSRRLPKTEREGKTIKLEERSRVDKRDGWRLSDFTSRSKTKKTGSGSVELSVGLVFALTARRLKPPPRPLTPSPAPDWRSAAGSEDAFCPVRNSNFPKIRSKSKIPPALRLDELQLKTDVGMKKASLNIIILHLMLQVCVIL